MRHITCLGCGLVLRFRSFARLTVRVRAHARRCWGQR